jgi:hypothetical protein
MKKHKAWPLPTAKFVPTAMFRQNLERLANAADYKANPPKPPRIPTKGEQMIDELIRYAS